MASKREDPLFFSALDLLRRGYNWRLVVDKLHEIYPDAGERVRRDAAERGRLARGVADIYESGGVVVLQDVPLCSCLTALGLTIVSVFIGGQDRDEPERLHGRVFEIETSSHQLYTDPQGWSRYVQSRIADVQRDADQDTVLAALKNDVLGVTVAKVGAIYRSP